MKKMLFLTAACVCGFCLTAVAADSIKVATKVNEALVYRSGAMLYRDGTVNLPKGTVELHFDDIARNVDASTVRVYFGDDKVVTSSVKCENKLIEDPAKLVKLADAEKRLRKVEDSLAQVKAQLEVCQSRKSLVLENKKIGGNQGVSIAELQRMSQFFQQELTTLSETELKLSGVIKDMETRQKKCADEVKSIKNSLKRYTNHVRVTVVSPVAKNKVPVRLEFLARDVWWNPQYEVRVGAPTEPLRLIYNAQVRQNTDNDWHNVHLKLTTGNPTLNNNKPVFNKIVISEQVIPLRKTAVNRSLAKAEVMMADAVFEEAEYEPAVELYTTVTDNSVGTEFDISLPYDIPSGKDEHRVEMLNFEIDAKYEYLVMPRQSKEVWLSALIPDYTGYALQPGNASLFVGNVFQGDVYLDPTTLSDTLNLSVGRDKDVLVSRTEVQNFTVRRTVGSNVKVQKCYDIVLKNNKKSAVTLKVVDQIPVSNDSNVDVKLVQAEGAALDAKTGMLTWNLTLAPGESKTLRLQYEVKYPKSMGYLRVD
ncbi:MAG: mucoidy inhibitor MuiA family protein [Paludibacteraceae bacterium]|nr:mucoidy inhibitor MuiA family protein [Paludibacteraceae bacterium]